LFNKKANDGIKLLIEKNIIPNDPAEIAKHLLITEGISKDQLGKYFGSPDEKTQKIFRNFCLKLDFKG